jgi:hypothetical protein
MPNKRKKNRRVAKQIASSFAEAGADQRPLSRDIRSWLFGIVWAVVLIPLIFFLRFGEVGPLGWGLTVFVVVLSLLVVVGLIFLRRPEYHTPVAERGGLTDRIGAFWLVACAFGPLIGWILTSAAPLTLESWRWVYGGRAALSVALPILTALPLVRYVKGRGAPVMIAILLGVTALPVWSSWSVAQDFWAGPVLLAEQGEPPTWYLTNTAQTVGDGDR